MWIKCERAATRRLYNAELMAEPVEFNETGTAQVPKSVGESLIDRYDSVTRYDADAETDTS